MKVTASLDISDHTYTAIWSHLFNRNTKKITEEACFALANVELNNNIILFQIFEWIPLGRNDFVSQRADYLELAQEARTKIIKRAHDKKASLVEFHSHPFSYPAAFSYSDLCGLREFVPHVWWRLKKRPYIAIVVSPTGYDSLVWVDDPNIPVALDHISVSGQLMRPTNRTIEFKECCNG